MTTYKCYKDVLKLASEGI